MDKILQKACIFNDASIRDAMLSLSDSCVGASLVVNAEFKLLGIVTDGDIRRAILSGAALADNILPFMQAEFLSVPVEAPRAEVLDLMKSRFIEQVPVLDKNGKVVGIHFLRQMLGSVEKPNLAVIMAGGRGERLKPLTDKVPKPMVRVAGRPILERIVLHLVGQGIRKIYISVNYLAEQIEMHFKNGHNFGCEIQYLREDAPLGTGGSLSLINEQINAPFIVLNGDLITQANFDEMLNKHHLENNYITLGIREYTQNIPFGCVEIDSGRVKSITEKPVLSKIINAGIYIFSPDNLKNIPPNSFFPITGLIERALESGQRVGVFPVDEEWADIGRPEELHKARGS